MPEPLFYRVREVAPLLGLSRSKAYELVMAGRIDSVLIDGCRRIPAGALSRFVDDLNSAAEHDSRMLREDSKKLRGASRAEHDAHSVLTPLVS